MGELFIEMFISEKLICLQRGWKMVNLHSEFVSIKPRRNTRELYINGY